MGKIFLVCKKYLKAHNLLISIFIGINIVTGFISVVFPYLSGNFIDTLILTDNISGIVSSCSMIAFVAISGLIFNYVASIIQIKLQTTMGHAFNSDVISHLQNVPIDKIQDEDVTYLSQKVNNDTNSLISFCLVVIHNIITKILLISIPLIYIWRKHSIVGLLIVSSAILYFFIFKLFQKKIYKSSFEYKECQAIYFSKVFEQLREIKFIKLQGINHDFINRLSEPFNGLLSKALRHQKISATYSGIDAIIILLVQILTFILAGLYVISGKLSIGEYTIINNYIHIIFASVRYFFNLGKYIQESLVCYNRINELKNIEVEQDGSIKIEKIHTVEINSLSFNIEEISATSKDLFRSFSYRFDSGNTYCITGPNGTGKSTFINIILGLYKAKNGIILYNDIPIENLNMQYLRENRIGVVDQELFLLSDTIFNNIFLDGKEKDLSDTYVLMEELGISELISSLPYGMNTKVNSSKNNLSGGEIQKLSILRALMKNPDLIILDEPMASLDLESSERLIKYLHEMKNGKIIIIITHNKEYASLCDYQIIFN